MHTTQEKTSQIANTTQGNKQWEGKNKSKMNYEKETNLKKNEL